MKWLWVAHGNHKGPQGLDAEYYRQFTSRGNFKKLIGNHQELILESICLPNVIRHWSTLLLILLHPFCLSAHLPPISPSLPPSLYPLHQDELLPQWQLMWIKYSTCQVVSPDESCSQASSATGEEQWVHAAPKKGSHVTYMEISIYVMLSLLLRTTNTKAYTDRQRDNRGLRGSKDSAPFLVISLDCGAAKMLWTSGVG